MPIAIRRLEPQEAAQAFPGRGRTDLSEYTDALSQLRAGDAAAVALEGLSSRTLKRRLTLAARALGYRIAWAKQAGGGELYLRVLQVPVDGSTWRGRKNRRTG